MPSRKSVKKPLPTSRPSSKTTDPPPTPPDWPSLTPLLPESDLSLQTVLPTQILIIRHLFTSTLCQKLINFFKTSLALNTTPAKPQKGEAVRVNDRFEVWDESFAERLWGETGLRELVTGRGKCEEGPVEGCGDVCGLNPRIRIYRYGKGQFFGKHCMYSLYHTDIPSILTIHPPSIINPTSDWSKLLLSNLFIQMTTPTPLHSQISRRRKRHGLSSSTLAPALVVKPFSTPNFPQSQSKRHTLRLWCSRRLAWHFYINMDRSAYCTKAAWSRRGRSGSLEAICA